MIRINLLPIKAAKKRERAERSALVLVLALAVEGAGLFTLHQWLSGGVNVIAQENAALTQQIEKLKQEVGDFDALKAQRERLMTQRGVIGRLESGRSGPVNMLLEISRILSSGAGPTVDPKEYEQIIRENPNKAIDPTWDPRRVVLGDFKETDGRAQFDAYAKDNSDVAEFVRRLDVSRYFDQPRLERSSTVSDSPAAKGVKHVQFAVNVQVKY